MGQELCFADRTCGGVLCVRVLATPWERLRGLLGTDAHAKGVVLVGCSSIHTMWMRYSLDVACVLPDGRVVEARRRVPPFRFVHARGAHYILERPSEDGYWPQIGAQLDVKLREGLE